jgi:hypothetical protein
MHMQKPVRFPVVYLLSSKSLLPILKGRAIPSFGTGADGQLFGNLCRPMSGLIYA